LRAQVVKSAHDLSAFGVEEGHIRGFTGAPGPPLFLLASPRPSHWSAQSWAAHHLKKQTALHHHQHQGATTKHTATPHDPTRRQARIRPAGAQLASPSGVGPCLLRRESRF